MKIQKFLFLFAGLVETVLGFPIIGGLLIVSLDWQPLKAALIMHLIIFLVALFSRPREFLAGSILGILANTLGIVPFLGMLLHLMAALVNFAQAFASTVVVIGGASSEKLSRDRDDDIIDI